MTMQTGPLTQEELHLCETISKVLFDAKVLEARAMVLFGHVIKGVLDSNIANGHPPQDVMHHFMAHVMAGIGGHLTSNPSSSTGVTGESPSYSIDGLSAPSRLKH